MVHGRAERADDLQTSRSRCAGGRYLQSLEPSVRIGLGVELHGSTHEQLTRVVIVKDGSDLNVDGVRVRAVRNSHFDDPPGHPLDDGSQSLSYRFDYEGYGIGYTGDTGPSDAVASLEQDVESARE